jgi:hypothetical protein
MNSMILANSSSAVSWTILTGIVTIGVAAGGYGWLKQQDKDVPGLLTIAGVGVLILAYGIWGSTSKTIFYYSLYFFIFPVVAAGIVFKAANSPDIPKTAAGSGMQNSTLFERSVRIQSVADVSAYSALAVAVQKDAMRDTLGLRLNELERFMGTDFWPTAWFFVGTEIVTTDGTAIAWAGRNGVERLSGHMLVNRHPSGRIQLISIGEAEFNPVRPEASVQNFVRTLTNSTERSSDV